MLSFSLAKPGDWQQLQARHEVIGFYFDNYEANKNRQAEAE
jgi:hypothetical protein